MRRKIRAILTQSTDEADEVTSLESKGPTRPERNNYVESIDSFLVLRDMAAPSEIGQRGRGLQRATKYECYLPATTAGERHTMTEVESRRYQMERGPR